MYFILSYTDAQDLRNFNTFSPLHHIRINANQWVSYFGYVLLRICLIITSFVEMRRSNIHSKIGNFMFLSLTNTTDDNTKFLEICVSSDPLKIIHKMLSCIHMRHNQTIIARRAIIKRQSRFFANFFCFFLN